MMEAEAEAAETVVALDDTKTENLELSRGLEDIFQAREEESSPSARSLFPLCLQ